MLGIIGQFNTYFFLLPLKQRLMSSGKNQISYSTLLEERNFFLPLYVRACMLCLPVPTLALHIVRVWPVLPNIIWLSWVAILQCATWKQDN